MANQFEAILKDGYSKRKNNNFLNQVRQKSSVTQKANALAIALGFMPVLLTGVATYNIAEQAVPQKIYQTKEARTTGLEEKVKQLLLLMTLGSGLTALLASAIASYIANRAMRSVLDVNNIETQTARLFGDIAASRARTSQDIENVFNRAVEGALNILKADRVVIYRFHPDWSGYISTEAVLPGWPRALADRIEDACISQHLIEAYNNGRVVPTDNVFEAGFHPDHLKLMERLQIKANLVTPIVGEDNLFGLLIAHHCSAPHTWLPSEIKFLKELASQLGLALTCVNLLDQKEAEIERVQQLNEITSRVRESWKVESIYDAAMTGVREALKTDRAVVYLFDKNWQGMIVAESVGHNWRKALGANIADPCFADLYVEKYKRGRVVATENIYEAGLSKCYLGQLEPFQVKANLVAPILAYNKLHGLLVTHQCSGPRSWQDTEINFFKQLAIQVGLALDRLNVLEELEQARQAAEVVSQEQRQQKEVLQQQLVALLDDIEGAASGDLTVRADVTANEIGTVADFFNAIIENLRQIVTKVKDSALQVSAAIGENEETISQLADAAMEQAEEIALTLDSVQQITLSIQAVAEKAHQAASVASTASDTAEQGRVSMDLTVQNISSLQEVIGVTAKRVKRLGESSQEISKIIALIEGISTQTKLLSINASIEAARAGEQGYGFAVVAEQVGQLATQSAEASQEIEKIVAKIQQETSEVAEGMEQSTIQVVAGTRRVEDAKQSLGQIFEVTRQIDQLVQSISEATVSQTQVSQVVSDLMKKITQVSEQTSHSSRKVSNSLQETVEVTQKLQESVSTFKVNKGLKA